MTAPGPDPSTRPVGVFDSGVGGLTVLHELLVNLPQEDFLYVGDTARFPYGERSAEELRRFSLEIADVLVERGAKLVVVACNSATSAALDTLERHLAATAPEVAVIGVVEPACRLAVQATRNRRVGLLATTATVRSEAYARAVAALESDVELVSVPCPELAPIIQEGFPFDQRVVDTVRAYCRPLRLAGVDTVILGSTHYPLVAPMLQRMLGGDVRMVASGPAVARRVEATLTDRALAHDGVAEGEYRFLCTGDVESFRSLGTRFLQMPLLHVSGLSLPDEAAA
ncbi:MAG: glutamate racemase [Solirubrobacteraceae bacterium]|nr:glutamate racemase [Solirubrobacteraceae bacterium]